MLQPSGLGNVGCTCYLNTALQCLSYCAPFLKFVLENDNNKGTLLKELKALLHELFTNNHNIIPKRFVSKINEICDFPVYQQNDIKVYFLHSNYILNGFLHNCISSVNTKHYDVLLNYF